MLLIKGKSQLNKDFDIVNMIHKRNEGDKYVIDIDEDSIQREKELIETAM